MNELLSKLEKHIAESQAEGLDATRILNSLKEYLQYAILYFVYNHKEYSNLVMYGGSLLRICHGLKRMSEDLDFQTEKQINLKKLASDLILHFKDRYDFDLKISIKDERTSDTKNLILRFDILDLLPIESAKKTLKIRFDLNTFSPANKFATETIPVVKDDYVFSIKTYTLSVLMASKVAAVFLRDKRSVGQYELGCKPRDIYDLEWYMEKKIVPDLAYLQARGLDFKNALDFFDALELRMNKIDDSHFGMDLKQFFYTDLFFDNWHNNWRQKFITLINSYEVFKITELQMIEYNEDFSTAVTQINFQFSTNEPDKSVWFYIQLGQSWYMYTDLKPVGNYRVEEIDTKIKNYLSKKLVDLDYQYIGLFYTKIIDYVKRNDRIVLQCDIKTKLIRADGNNLNVKKQTLLSRSILPKIKLEELFF